MYHVCHVGGPSDRLMDVVCVACVDCHVGGPSDRLMGVVIGVSISSGCIVVCVIIILLRNRFGYVHW